MSISISVCSVGDGGGVWQSFGAFRLYFMCSWSINLLDGTSSPAQRLSTQHPGETHSNTTVLFFLIQTLYKSFLFAVDIQSVWFPLLTHFFAVKYFGQHRLHNAWTMKLLKGPYKRLGYIWTHSQKHQTEDQSFFFNFFWSVDILSLWHVFKNSI